MNNNNLNFQLSSDELAEIFNQDELVEIAKQQAFVPTDEHLILRSEIGGTNGVIFRTLQNILSKIGKTNFMKRYDNLFGDNNGKILLDVLKYM